MAAFNRGKVGEARMADGFTGPSYFVWELDGDTAPTRALAAQWEQERLDAEAEIAAEVGYERFLETNDRYRWECEEDERRAAALSADFDRWQESIWCSQG
ncbi:hypothetical protein HOU95_gp091 [Streptomyces phage Hiyaa]|uniref:Uncharacterized protein n=1 Tax=Streptomyces phage Hiyaa TaxID=2499072 RepID=A0A3S9U8S5_9CAUD|nr:hypothetical protein HOU95_gp091 [Streptomyces phage Hiyaa]AZS06716.1 hypothetical protein SEA_HIYAA_77 [Streptomyces phage Hiyaa]